MEQIKSRGKKMTRCEMSGCVFYIKNVFAMITKWDFYRSVYDLLIRTIWQAQCVFANINLEIYKMPNLYMVTNRKDDSKQFIEILK